MNRQVQPKQSKPSIELTLSVAELYERVDNEDMRAFFAHKAEEE